MSKRNKLQKFSQLLTFPNVFENFSPLDAKLVGKDGQEVEMKGEWAEKYFKNNNPITLELACGKGDYTVGLARHYPDRNFIGVDIKGARIWKGAGIALEEGLNNVAFLRTRIEQIALFFEPEEVSEIWITFPDPFLNERKAKRRLTAPRFIQEYRKILKPGGLVHLKTDEPNLYDYSLEALAEDTTNQILYKDDDIYAKALYLPELEIKTFYEKMHLQVGKTIKYIQFKIN